MGDTIHSDLIASDQKCKECKRRGAKCDRILPRCSACAKFKRHCLYDKHSKSPLTRKHLTEVETRLEHTEALLRKYQQYGPPPSRVGIELLRPAMMSSGSSDHRRKYMSTLDPGAGNHDIMSERKTASNYSGNPAAGNWDDVLDSEGFSWDERFRPIAFGDSRSFNERVKDSVDPIYDNEDEVALDGMAMLTFNDKDYGYMGSATGAAFLKYLWRWPSGAPSKFTKTVDLCAGMACPSIAQSVDPCKIIADPFIDAYFSTFHCIFPLVHEPSFRAVYSRAVPQPAGSGWAALANIVAAVGGFSAMTKCLTIDTPFYYAAKKSLSIECLETGSLNLVQALVLMSDYLQKRNKPNSGYVYAGLARRMAYGLGMHKEFSRDDSNIFQKEARRRVWWTIFIIDCNISMTLSRPLSAIDRTTDVKLPANINERDLTQEARAMPSDRPTWTLYSSLRAQARICVGIQDLYTYSISNLSIDTQKLMSMDDQMTANWSETIPAFEKNVHSITSSFALASAITGWKLCNLRIVIYRPFLFEQIEDPAVHRSIHSARNRCLNAAHEAIASTSEWWAQHQRTRVAAWHVLYFIFQAVLVPISCLRRSPTDESSKEWIDDIKLTLNVIEEMHFIHSSKCAAVVHRLVDSFIMPLARHEDAPPNTALVEGQITSTEIADSWSQNLSEGLNLDLHSFLESRELANDQMNDAWRVMWPGVPSVEQALLLEEHGWLNEHAQDNYLWPADI